VEQLLESADLPAEAQVDYSIRVKSAANLNLADFQNSVPLLRELMVVNESAHALTELKLRLDSHPPFLKAKTWSIDACDPRSRYGIKDCDVLLDGVLLSKLTEAETATVTFTLIEKAGTSRERVLATEERKVELLPRNQWGGLSSLPD